MTSYFPAGEEMESYNNKLNESFLWVTSLLSLKPPQRTFFLSLSTRFLQLANMQHFLIRAQLQKGQEIKSNG